VLFYDRNDLIEKAVYTVQKVLVEAVVLVVVLLVLFLGNLRAALVVSQRAPTPGLGGRLGPCPRARAPGGAVPQFIIAIRGVAPLP
jgi:hypothetical protein